MSQEPISTVYVVDDDPDVCRSLKQLLESDHLRAETFQSAREFLDLYSPDLAGCLLLDIRMPRVSGLDLLDELNQHPGTRMPVIVITGHGDVPTAVRALRNGAIDFLEKPFQAQDLLDRVHAALASDAEIRRRNAEIAAIRERLAQLSTRERQVLDLVVRGEPNKAIAGSLGITIRTVEVHRSRVMTKMNADHITELVRMLLQAGIGEPNPAQP